MRQANINFETGRTSDGKSADVSTPSILYLSPANRVKLGLPVEPRELILPPPPRPIQAVYASHESIFFSPPPPPID